MFIKSLINPNKISILLKENYHIKNTNIILIKSQINDIYEISNLKNKYVLKIYNSNKIDTDINFEVEFTKFINKDMILDSINGSGIIKIKYPEGYRCAILLNYIDGKILRYKNSNDAYKYGVNVAKFHIKAQGFKSNLNKQININKRVENSVNIIKNHLKLENIFINDFNFIADELNERIQKINFTNLTKGYFHGDLHGGNFICNHKINKFIDFEDCNYGYLVLELATFLWACLIGKRNNQWDIFLDAYKSIKNIEEEDLVYIKTFVAIRDIIIMSKYLENINIFGKEMLNSKYISKRIKFLNELLEEK